MKIKEKEEIFTARSGKNERFDKRLINHVVMLAEQGVPRRTLIKEYGMNPSTLLDWIQRSGSGLKRRKSYSVSEKRSVVRAISSGMSIKQAQIAFKISYPSVIRKWMVEFSGENAEISVIKPLEMAKKKTDDLVNTELKALQKALDEANLKIKALDTLIDIAQEQLKIDIRKKSGAKQSSK